MEQIKVVVFASMALTYESCDVDTSIDSRNAGLVATVPMLLKIEVAHTRAICVDQQIFAALTRWCGQCRERNDHNIRPRGPSHCVSKLHLRGVLSKQNNVSALLRDVEEFSAGKHRSRVYRRRAPRMGTIAR